MGFLKPDSGRVLIDGQDVTDFSEDQFSEVRRKVTMVFQSGALFDSLTVADNIAFPLEGQPGLTQEDIDEYVNKLAQSAGSGRRAGQIAGRAFDRKPARGGHCAGAGSESRRDSVRRADHDGGSDHGRAHGRSDRAPERSVSQDIDRRDARHASGEETGGHDCVPARRQSRRIRIVGGIREHRRTSFCTIFSCKTN